MADKRILNKGLFKRHFRSLFNLKDKETLKMYIINFIQCASYLGYEDLSINEIKSFTQAFRIIYNDPANVDRDLLLDFLVLLALSHSDLSKFDSKSVAFINKALEQCE